MKVNYTIDFTNGAFALLNRVGYSFQEVSTLTQDNAFEAYLFGLNGIKPRFTKTARAQIENEIAEYEGWVAAQ